MEKNGAWVHTLQMPNPEGILLRESASLWMAAKGGQHGSDLVC